MNPKHFILALSLIFAEGNLFSQTNRLFFPFLDKESQINVLVAVCDFNAGQTCPPQFTNALSNTNLFTPEQQKLIKESFVKYKNVTTNSGPPGTVLIDLYKTNYVIKAMNRDWPVENWTANFQHTNSGALERITFGGGMQALYRNKANDGYNVSFTRTGGGTLLGFGEVKHGLPNGLFIRVDDGYPQGQTWDYKLANFTNNSVLEEYRQYTNGLVLGKFLMWNSRNNNLMLEAEFKEPYEFEKHRTDLRMLQKHP